MTTLKLVENGYYKFKCPHCSGNIVVNPNDLNCCIFRHAVRKDTLEPINPHASKEECDYLLSQKIIYGCAKPFRIINNKAEICDYI